MPLDLIHSSLLRTHLDAFLLASASSTDNFMVGISVGLSSAVVLASKSNNNKKKKHGSNSNAQQSLARFYKVNLVIALCNATGTLLATYGGDMISRVFQQALISLAAAVSSSSTPETYTINISIESLLAALAFAYLAWKEYKETNGDSGNDKNDQESKNDKDKNSNSSSISYSIAVPMTCNNLAGGVAGGVLGLSVAQATLYAFLVSFGSMALGHTLAHRLVGRQCKKATEDPSSATTMAWCKYISILIYLTLSLQSLYQI